MPNLAPFRSIAVFGVALLGFSSISCQERGYRTEVIGSGEGGVQTRQVPVAVASRPVVARDASSATPAPAVLDDDVAFTKMQTLWPALSEGDRAAVVNMAQRLASHGK